MEHRREFLEKLAAAGAVVAVAACAPKANLSASPQPAPASNPLPPAPPTSSEGPWDHRWLDSLTARHKQYFDVASYSQGGALFYAKNYLNGVRDGWGAEYPDVPVVLGMHGDAYPIVFQDQLWQKFEWGKEKKTDDPRTKAPAVRNVFWQPKQGEPMFEFGVDVLQKRGAVFILCNNVLRFVTRTLAARTGSTYADMRKELIAGLLPGVTVVPAMVAACGMAQQKGCTYVYAGE
jgi:hypothetical protein